MSIARSVYGTTIKLYRQSYFILLSPYTYALTFPGPTHCQIYVKILNNKTTLYLGNEGDNRCFFPFPYTWWKKK